MKAFSLYTPTKIYFGAGTWKKSLQAVAEMLQGNVMVVTTGRSLIRLGYLPALLEELKQLREGRECLVYSNIHANPKLAEVEEAVALGKEAQIDTVIGFGGGSAMDAAKAVAAGIGSPHPVAELLLKGIAPSAETPRIIAMPTTAGTGSELSKGAILSSPEHHIKTGIRGEHIYPAVAIVDSTFTWQVPRRVTVETGFDVLAHAIESYVSRKATDFSRLLSERAIRIVGDCLPALLETPDQHEARDVMSYASMLMGINLGNVGTALPHRMQYPVGANTDTSHGAGLMALYPAWLRHEYDAAPEKIQRVIRVLTGTDYSDKVSCCSAMDAFLERLGERRNLQELGLRPEQAASLAAQVTGNIQNDRAASEPDVLAKIYSEAMQ